MWRWLSFVSVLGMLCPAASGQTPKPIFEVTSVKPATPLGPGGMQSDAGGGPGTNDPGRYHCHNCPIFWVLSPAYDLKLYEYSGPEWVHSVRYDFDAKIPPGTTHEAFRSMLQNLLADRFKLVVHREKRDMPAYELTVTRNGPKFHEGVSHDDPKPEPGPLKKDKDGFPILTPGMSMALGPGLGRIRSDNQPLAWFAHLLSQQLQGPVVDNTGLQARYDFMVSWAFKSPGVSATSDAVDEFQPALIEAVQSQLGLKLAKKKMPVEVLVVDRLERTPTEN
jgi:uncharacterized protein (TIGR03435 family)